MAVELSDERAYAEEILNDLVATRDIDKGVLTKYVEVSVPSVWLPELINMAKRDLAEVERKIKEL
jgi:hypothetical protein